MTKKEVIDKISAARWLREADSMAIVAMARQLAPALRDANLTNQALELERLLFIYDAHAQELNEWTVANLADIARLAAENFGVGEP